MTPDDPRHGEPAGYVAGCRDRCCRQALAAWARRARARRRAHGSLIVSGTGTRRRIQALMALGWATTAIDEALGQKRTYTAAILCADGDAVRLTTAQRIAYLYERMAMTLPPQSTRYERQSATRCRNYARRMGWPPPLAWDDIDDPHEQPTNWEYRPSNRRESFLELDAAHIGISEACARLGVTKDALEKWSTRQGLTEAFQRMDAREDGLREWRNQYTSGRVA